MDCSSHYHTSLVMKVSAHSFVEYLVTGLGRIRGMVALTGLALGQVEN